MYIASSSWFYLKVGVLLRNTLLICISFHKVSPKNSIFTYSYTFFDILGKIRHFRLSWGYKPLLLFFFFNFEKKQSKDDLEIDFTGKVSMLLL